MLGGAELYPPYGAYGSCAQYGAAQGEWRGDRVKLLRKLVRNGNSTQITIPPQVLEYLGWRSGMPVIVELTAAKTIEVRPPTVADMRSADAIPMTLDLVTPGA